MYSTVACDNIIYLAAGDLLVSKSPFSPYDLSCNFPILAYLDR